MDTETINWHQLPSDGLPDADMNVLLQISFPDGGRDGEASEVWPGWLDAGHFVDASSGRPVPLARVMAWADMPAGPTPC